jgi:hypothetical protein
MQPNPEAATCGCCRRKANLQSTTALALALGMGTLGMGAMGTGALTLGGAALILGLATPVAAGTCAGAPRHAKAPQDLDAAALRNLQTALNDAGHRAGPADGIWGPRTRGALISFQRDKGIEATAELDAETVEALGLATILMAAACAANPCAANPCAADPCAAANPCAADPCAANPCAVCDPCAPCAAMGCAACDPCAAGAGSATGCYVPRLQEAAANPCAVDPCGPAAVCGPTAACGPCDADPCAANPCAADACAPCAAMDCAACAPGAAMACAACDPCAPCGPCAAAAPPPEVSDEELRALYDCLMQATQAMEASGATTPLLAAWTESGRAEADDFSGWRNFAATPYISFTHGERFATNHANAIAAEVYGLYEEIGEMPAGGIVAKPTFSVGADGQAYWETLFLMEKAPPGTSADTNDWIYTAIMPDGALMGRTLGPNSAGMQFCADCHIGMSDGTDDLLFMDEEYRVRN